MNPYNSKVLSPVLMRILYWAFIAAFLILYVTSTGFLVFIKNKMIPWYRQAYGIIRHSPAMVDYTNIHARQTILTRSTSAALSAEVNDRYFSKWSQGYLYFQKKALQDELADGVLSASLKPRTWKFLELNALGKLKFANMEKAKEGIKESLDFTAQPGSRVEVTLPEPIDPMLYDSLEIKMRWDYSQTATDSKGRVIPNPPEPLRFKSGEMEYCEANDYIRLFWHSEKRPGFSGERSVILPLYDKGKDFVLAIKPPPHVIDPFHVMNATSFKIIGKWKDIGLPTHIGNNYTWLSGGKVSKVLLLFQPQKPINVTLEEITLSP